MMQFTRHQDINKDLYDQCMASSSNPKIYGRSWWLDIVHPGWDCLVWDNYRAVCPITSKSRFWIKRCVQPAFTQQLGVFDAGENLHARSMEALTFLQKTYRSGLVQWHDQNLDVHVDRVNSRKRKNYILHLDDQPRFSSNHRRAINKGQKCGLELQVISEEDFFNFFAKNNPVFTSDIKPHQAKWKRLIHGILQHNGQILGARNVDGLHAAIAWGIEQDTMYYLFPAIAPSARDTGANPWLIQASLTYWPEIRKLDFEGSEVRGVENFFRQFDPQLSPYPLFTW